ncbi:TlpA disulfide reductase family protein [Rhizosphaericola mali]|uniref:TlpA disulfide reductase family protein n=1 Tax=Rhizosphaericola mali TaxID=2545455 RepID=UPI00177AA001|nr:TlpA disulfide reductase family protein [Rhizosphaericola mali]
MQLLLVAGHLHAQNKQTKQGSHFSIEGHISNPSTKLIMLEYMDDTNNYIRKKSNIVNGTFSFEGFIKEPTFAQLVGNVDSSRGVDFDDPNIVNIFIEAKKMKINVVEKHFKEFQMTGSVTQDQRDALERSKSDIYKKFNPIVSKYRALNVRWKAALKANDTLDANDLMNRENKILTEKKSYEDQLTLKNVQFIRDHPNSFLSGFLLYGAFVTHQIANDSAIVYFNSLSQNVQTGYYGNEFERLLIKKVAPIGSDFTSIVGSDIKGKQVSMDGMLEDSSTYTLIVFWASWCVPCRALNSTIKEVYQKYHSKKLNIIYVTLDEDRQKWLDAIKKDEISDFQHFYNDKKINLFYNYGLTSIPADFLVKGKTIIAKYSGADQEHSDFRDIETKLKQIFPSS